MSNAREQLPGGATSSASVPPSQVDIEAMFAEARAVDALLQRIGHVSLAIAWAVDFGFVPAATAANSEVSKVTSAFRGNDPSH